MSEPSDTDRVFAYHRRTKHRFEAYAPGPPAHDWDAQPAPFRRFAGAPVVRLPLASEASPMLQAALQRPWRGAVDAAFNAAVDVESLGVLLNLSLALTAWKSYGSERWALRANPSSGNLHPVEAYVIAVGIAGLADGVHHYRPDDHALECRAAFGASAGRAPLLAIGISTVMWREAWKYGERAFRYCQLDVGHAVAGLAYAAAALGWTLHQRRELATSSLASLLGVDRAADFPASHRADTEREEAELLLQLAIDGQLAALDPPALLADARWQGVASVIDPAPMQRWPIIDEVAAATRTGGGPSAEARPVSPPTLPTAAAPGGPPLADVILNRRSAQRFNPRATLAAGDFFTLLAATLPGAGAPWFALAAPPRISLVLFVHRVDGLEPGLYLLARQPQHRLPLAGRYVSEPVTAAPPGLPFFHLTTAEPQELRRLARAIHCHQDIASNACFALGMVAEFAAPIAADPAAYRDLLREAGAIGQVLYLEAEACAMRGTGIGCFFDDPFHEVLGLTGEAFQTLYHFTVGVPMDDARLETSAAYSGR